MRYAILSLALLPAGFGQQADSAPYLRNELSAGFRYEVKLGQNSYNLNDASGYDVKYSYRPVRWLALEAGMEQIFRPIGSSICCRYQSTAADDLFLVPFGVRYVWAPATGRLRLSAGGGGAYFNHAIGNEISAYDLVSLSAWGGQFVAGGDYALTRSGRFRAGLTVRYYYVPVRAEQVARILTVGPDFTFSFR
jgi:hypothetical protein